MWSLLAPFIDELGAAAIGRLFLWRRGPQCVPEIDCALPAFDGSLDAFYSTQRAAIDWRWTTTARKNSGVVEITDGFFDSPVRTGFPANDRVFVRRWCGEA